MWSTCLWSLIVAAVTQDPLPNSPWWGRWNPPSLRSAILVGPLIPVPTSTLYSPCHLFHLETTLDRQGWVLPKSPGHYSHCMPSGVVWHGNLAQPHGLLEIRTAGSSTLDGKAPTGRTLLNRNIEYQWIFTAEQGLELPVDGQYWPGT